VSPARRSALRLAAAVCLLAAACARSSGDAGDRRADAPRPGAAIPRPEGARAAKDGHVVDRFADISIEDPSGHVVRFSDFKGQVLVIDFWASWCGPCRMTIPELNTIHERYHDRGLAVIGVSVDENPADVIEFQHHIPMRYPVGMINRALAARVGGEPSSIPTTLLVDRSGVPRRKYVGYVDASTLEQAIQDLL
jgi:thiol-disulfide isomerase/thioredoxin